MTFQYDLGDKIANIFSPEKSHTITKRYNDGLGRNIYHWEGGASEEKHLKLISKTTSHQIYNLEKPGILVKNLNNDLCLDDTIDDSPTLIKNIIVGVIIGIILLGIIK